MRVYLLILAATVCSAVHTPGDVSGLHMDCPWKTPTVFNDRLECNDGSFCYVPDDPTVSHGNWSCCNALGGRKRCPAGLMMCAQPEQCASGMDHCCETDCTLLGGVRGCDHEPGSAFFPKIQHTCAFLTTTSSQDKMECNDGTYCEVPTNPDTPSDMWKCCIGHGGRARCPLNTTMCGKPYACAGGSDYCCENSADACYNKVLLGPRSCPAEQCPFLTTTTSNTLMECNNGSLVEVPADLSASSPLWSTCTSAGFGGRKRCPAGSVMCAKPNSCGGGESHCCEADCSLEGGPRVCEECAIDINWSDYPHIQTTSFDANLLECNDNTFCEIPTLDDDPLGDDPRWRCCNKHGGRKRCALDQTMCSLPFSCAGGTSHCCEADCQLANMDAPLTCEGEICPWIVPSSDNTIMVCNDGFECTVPADLTNVTEGALMQWRCCNDHGGRKHCPKGSTMCAVPNNCGGGLNFCCEADCSAQGGPRVCPKEKCPWMLSTASIHMMECMDGYMCPVPSNPSISGDAWKCCNSHGGRLRCPANTTMCATPNNCGGGQNYCCEWDCTAEGGPRLCPSGDEGAQDYCQDNGIVPGNTGTEQLLCKDGTYCTVPTLEADPLGDDPRWRCCNSHGGRAMCADGMIMCSLPFSCAGGTSHCCESDCKAAGMDAPLECGGTNENVCPWITSTSSTTIMLCNDGFECTVPSDPLDLSDAALAQWRCCNDHGGRAQCPKGTTMCATPNSCGGGENHCCEPDCGLEGGPRVCPTETCPWMLTTDRMDRMECVDGFMCEVPANPNWSGDAWKCCNAHGGRLRCPANTTMCAKANNCGGGLNHCCEWDCSADGGPLLCPAGADYCEDNGIIPGDTGTEDLLCKDGTYCTVPTLAADPQGNDPRWRCCNSHGGRAQCADGMIMCSLPFSCAGGTSHCCESDCQAAGMDAPLECGGTNENVCPWTVSTSSTTTLLCNDGFECTVPSDPLDVSDAALAQWRCCNDHGGRAQCPKGTTMCAKANSCGGGLNHCCEPDCNIAEGGPRVCPSETCPWRLTTDRQDRMECMDGFMCEVPANPNWSGDAWKCCNAHGGRLRCPANTTMCAKEKSCGGGLNYCCEWNCAAFDGDRPCPGTTTGSGAMNTVAATAETNTLPKGALTGGAAAGVAIAMLIVGGFIGAVVAYFVIRSHQPAAKQAPQKGPAKQPAKKKAPKKKAAAPESADEDVEASEEASEEAPSGSED